MRGESDAQIDPVVSLLTQVTADAEPFWRAATHGELHLPKCLACGRFSYFPRLLCPHCSSRELAFTAVEGRGQVHSFTHVRFSPFGQFWQEELPYTVVRVDLPERVRLLSRLVGADRESVQIGDAVEVRFAPVKASERKIPVFVRSSSVRSKS